MSDTYNVYCANPVGKINAEMYGTAHENVTGYASRDQAEAVRSLLEQQHPGLTYQIEVIREGVYGGIGCHETRY
jgi:hypothetical protein